jgi:hypothetical protein
MWGVVDAKDQRKIDKMTYLSFFGSRNAKTTVMKNKGRTA